MMANQAWAQISIKAGFAFGASTSSRTSLILVKGYATVKDAAPKVDQRQLVLQREREQKRLQLKREENMVHEKLKNEARIYKSLPITMEVCQALRYVRAAEVGRTAHASTISLQMRIVAEKGVPKVTGAVRLPHRLKEEKICVLTSDSALAEQARRAGANMVGSDEIIALIREHPEKFDAERVYATPDMVSRVNQVARILGPRGLMPSARRGTLVSEIFETVTAARGETTFKQANDMIIMPVARASFSDTEAVRNILAAVNSVRERLSSVQSAKKGSIGRTTLVSTNSPNISIIV